MSAAAALPSRAASNDAAQALHCVARGRVGILAEQVGTPGFFEGCARRYREAQFGELGESEFRSWKASWPPLLRALVRAGLGEFYLYLELEAPGGTQRWDALLLGSGADDRLVAVIVELKQWQTCRPTQHEPDLVLREDGELVVHPIAQITNYAEVLTHWFSHEHHRLEGRCLLLMHNATAQASAQLPPHNKASEVVVLSGEDLGREAEDLRSAMRCDDLIRPTELQVHAFTHTTCAPSTPLMHQVGANLRKESAFTLVGDQQQAFLRIRRAVKRARDGRGGQVIAVSGPPGSGKTAIAVQLMAALLDDPQVRPRYVTQSAALRAHLQQAAGSSAGGGLFIPPSRAHGLGRAGTKVVVLDEAQRLPRQSDGFCPDLRRLMKDIPVLVVFLDELQVIRPNEGVTVQAIEAEAHRLGRGFGEQPPLAGSFRNNGSKAFTSWVDDLFYGQPSLWSGVGYDLATLPGPFHLHQWIDDSIHAGLLARTSAGFCWPWARQGGLPNEVRIPGTDPATGRTALWARPWNADKEVVDAQGHLLAPSRTLWASAPGGHDQIGCIYTTQGLEYQNAGVIFGDDLVRRGNRWRAQPSASHDDKLMYLSEAEYLPLALNIYRILITRGTRACRLISTDPETQRFLKALTT